MQNLMNPLALELVYLVNQERLGRRRLAQRTGLSEMAVRLELERLRDSGYITMDKSGVALGEKGKTLYFQALKRIKEVRAIALESITRDSVSQAALLSYSANKAAWRYRDLVIGQGGSALLMLCYGKRGWFFPDNNEVFRDQNAHDASLIESAFPMRKQGDLLVIVSAPDLRSCGLSLWKVLSEIICKTS